MICCNIVFIKKYMNFLEISYIHKKKRGMYMEHGSISYISLLIIILLATFVPVVIKKIKFLPLPIVVGEIITGMIVGKSGFNLIQQSRELDFLNAFGFAFLMFLSGLEIDFGLMRPTGSQLGKKEWHKKPLLISIFIFLGTLLLSFLIANLLKQFGLVSNTALTSLILSTTSLGIVVPILKEKNIINTEYGQTILLTSLISDFVTMVLITFFVTFYTSTAFYEMFLVLLLFVAFFVFYRMGLRIAGAKILKELANTTSQIKVRGAFALILIFIALAQILGTEIILGAFLAGLIVSLLDEKDTSDLYLKLDAIGYGFFVPIFFIMVGANFDLKSVLGNPKSLVLVPALIVAVYLVKIVPTLLLKKNYSWKKTIAAGFLLSSRLSLIIAASAIGLKLGLIRQDTNGAIILVAIITCTFSPFIFNHMLPTQQVDRIKNIFIIGISDKTVLLSRRLQNPNVAITFITKDEVQYQKLFKIQENVFLGDPTNSNWLASKGIEKADTIIVAMSNEEVNTEICRICKEEFGKDHIVLLTNSQSTPKGESLYGAMSVSPEFATVFMAEKYVMSPKTFHFLFKEEDFAIKEVYLNNPNYYDKPLNKIVLPGDCLILSIMRGSEKIIPHGQNILKPQDLIMIVGSSSHVKKAENILMG